jgi:putative SOS response-associated peptidase YedK
VYLTYDNDSKRSHRRPPLAPFAGIWRPWIDVRGSKTDPVEGEHLLYSFLTSEPNGVVGPIHPKAMPVILTTPKEYDVWLNAPTEEVLKPQRHADDRR